MLRLKPIHILYLFIPASVISSKVMGHSVATFCLSVLALIPLSILIGQATEQLALHFGPLVGGLMNATFGNATELVIGLFGLQAGLLPMVRASITGSIIGNLLLVLGMGALAGGMKHKEQEFGKPTGSLMSTLMLLAVIGLVVPAVFSTAGEGPHPGPAQTLSLSVVVAVVLLVTYCLGLLFSLKTHHSLFTDQEAAPVEIPTWSKQRATVALLATTLLVCLESELVVRSVSITARQSGLTQMFIGVIIVAIVGNASEHATAVWMAYKGRMDICVSVAVGSSAQIALFVAPVLVLGSLSMAHPLNFIFAPFELIAVILAVAIAHFVGLDGKTNWFEGAQLLAVYLILAAAFYYLPG